MDCAFHSKCTTPYCNTIDLKGHPLEFSTLVEEMYDLLRFEVLYSTLDVKQDGFRPEILESSMHLADSRLFPVLFTVVPCVRAGDCTIGSWEACFETLDMVNAVYFVSIAWSGL